MRLLQARASRGQTLGLPLDSQLPFYLENVGLAGELVAELLNFLFGKDGQSLFYGLIYRSPESQLMPLTF